jgi:hypothetical protein
VGEGGGCGGAGGEGAEVSVTRGMFVAALGQSFSRVVCDGFSPAFLVGQVRAPFDFAQGRLCPYENRFWLGLGGFVVAAVPIDGAA